MHWFKRGLYASLLAMALLGANAVAAGPASASVTQNHCNRNVCMQLSRNSASGRTVYYAYVYMPGALQGAVVRIMYVGYSKAGSLKGPQKDASVSCNPLCAAKFTINYTYASGDWDYGAVIMSGTTEGTPTFTF
jgi:hypothetical protein